MNARLSRLLDALRDPNPIVRKELLAALRAPLYVRAVIATLVLLGLLVITVALNAAQGNNPTQSGRALFQVFFGGAFLAMALVGPAFGATAIVQEREGRSLDALLLTGMAPGRIVVGKLVAVFVVMAFILVVSVPLLAVVSLFGGISLGHIAVATAYVLSFGALAVAYGLAVSAQVQTTRLALLGALPVSLIATLVGGVLLTAFGQDMARRHALAFEGPFFFADAYFAMAFDGTYAAVLVALPAYLLGTLGWLFGATAYTGLLEATQDRALPLKRWALGAILLGFATLRALHAATLPTYTEKRTWCLVAMVLVALLCLALAFAFVSEPITPSRRMAQARPGPLTRALMPPTLGPSLWFVVGLGAAAMLLGPMLLCGLDRRLLMVGLWGACWVAAQVGLMGWLAARRPGQGTSTARTAGVLAQLATMIAVWIAYAFLAPSGNSDTHPGVLVVSPPWAVSIGADCLRLLPGSHCGEALGGLLRGAGVYALAAVVLLTQMQRACAAAARRG